MRKTMSSIVSLIFFIIVSPILAADKEVVVANTIDNPVPVTIDGEFLKIPFQRQQQDSQVSDVISIRHHYQVPDGYKLVIESFSVYTSLPVSQVLFRSSITTTASGETVEHHFDLPEVSVILSSRNYRGLHSVRLYADSGTNVILSIAKQDVATGTLTVFSSISGFLIPDN